ncbi:MAG: ATP-binding protein [Planctomycetota bacterium]|jgi:signal transduction histidine kinase/ActR/RegA family two-component response regulator
MGNRDEELQERIEALEKENARLRAGIFTPRGGDTFRVPEPFKELFYFAQQTVGAYFNDFLADPSQGTIEISGERYVLVRASALSYGFLDAIRKLYADRGDAEALHIGKTLLFDMAHVIGINDARNFHEKMGVTDPIAKMSAGPVHFAYSGWAFVEILPESNPTPGDDFFLTYHHPFSFESDAWVRAGKQTDFPVCTMNAGYSSGWCEESFGIPLAAAEIACRACGDDNCTFVLAPPRHLSEQVARALAGRSEQARRRVIGDIPTLFERKDAEERLRDALERAEAASSAKSMFLANMSHEIRTPLTGLLGMADLLLRQELGPQQRRYVETIDQSGHALLGVLNDILDLSKIEAGMLAIRTAPCDPRKVLNEVADVLKARVAEKGLAMQIEIDDTVPSFVMADAMRLRQVLLNLAGNAVKFTETGGITLRAAWEAPGSLRVEVEDTGIGIDPADLPRLFEVFTQADASDSRRHAGSGLGLSISRRLVELMGGELGADSELGAGSTFRFHVPAVSAQGEDPDDGEPVLPQLKFDANVLLVEDDKVTQYVVEQLLIEQGCRVETAANGREAVAAVIAGHFDLVFMDCQMPDMDGYEATARIRQLEGAGRRTPIVAMTASVMDGTSVRCRTVGMDGFLGKPLDLKRLQSILARWTPKRT